MKYPYIVNRNGVWYPAGTEVPEGDNSSSKERKQTATIKYTKTEINRMSTAELKDLAIANEIENANDMTGTELKKVLIKHFEL